MQSTSSIVERVGRSSEEFALLCAIVDDLASDTPRREYATWLQALDDQRGLLLNEFLAACDAGRELPSLEGVSSAWCDITGLTIIGKIAESQTQAFRDEILASARPALRLVVDELVVDVRDFRSTLPAPDALGTTRLGGDPDLPAGASFPTAADGVPLHFLGQFNLADFQGTVGGRAFPASGLLSLFRTQSDGMNCYSKNADFPRLVQLTPQNSRLTRLVRPTGLMDPPDPYRPELQIVETLRLPADLSKWPDTPISQDDYWKLDRVYPTNLGGTAYIVLGHVTHGSICDEPICDRPDWVQLVLVPYTEGPDFGVNDMSLSYHLPAADLKTGRFDRLEATFG